MKLLLYILTLFISINLYAWKTQFSDDGLCGEETDFKVDGSFWESTLDYYDECSPTDCSPDYYNAQPNYFNLNPDHVIHAAKLAGNWWNQAGSEHELNYSYLEYNSTIIKLVYINDTPSMVTYPAWEAWGDICIDGAESEIFVNAKHWNTRSTGHPDYTAPNRKDGMDFITTLTHEFGHLLGLDHTNVTSYEKFNMMRPGAGQMRHITEDDKYGAGYIYGRDENIMRTTVGSFDSSNNLNLENTYWYMSGNSYDTFVKPSIVFQPDPNNDYDWDYIVTWVDSDTKKVNYAFTKDGGTNSKDMITVRGPYIIDGYESMSSPSIAITEDGKNAMLVFRSEDENGVESTNKDTIISVKIYTKIDSTPNDIYGYHDSPVILSGETFGTSSHTKSVPIVVWKKDGTNYQNATSTSGKFLVFWNERNSDLFSEYNWKIKYAISDRYFNSSSNIDFSYAKELKYNGVPLYSMWNQMSVNCDFESHNRCLLFFNEVFPETSLRWDYLDYQRLSRVFISTDSNVDNLFVNSNSWYGNHFRYSDKFNYGDLSLIRTPSSSKEFMLTYIYDAKQQNKIWSYNVDIVSGGTSTSTTTVTDPYNNKWTRTGHSGVYNPNTGKYRFIWIQQ